MKGFKKLALVAAIAAPFSSVHALEALDDSTLSGMTGQAGVTIELDTKVTMDSFTYTDTDGGASGEIGGGSVVMNDVRFGGANVSGLAAATFDAAATDRLDEVTIDIDVASTGNLVIHLGSTDTQGVLDGTNPLDFGLYVGSLEVSGDPGVGATVNSTIVSDINLRGTLGPQDIVIANDGGNGLIKAQGYFEIQESSMNIDVAGVGISNLTISQDDAFNSNTYIDKDGNAQAKMVDYGVVLPAKGLTDGTGSESWAFYGVTIDTVTSGTGVTDALSLTVDSFNVDIAMDVGIGNGSANNIGHIAMENLNVSGTQMVIYGH